jgi:ATP-binding cassette subfamily F protein uup
VKTSAPSRSGAAAGAPPAKRRRLTLKEAKELAELPERIDALERERGQLYTALGGSALLRDGEAAARAKTRLAELGALIDETTGRWETLETIATGG